MHPDGKFERQPFWHVWSYEIKVYGADIIFNGMTPTLNFIKVYRLVQKLIEGTITQADTDTETHQ